MAEMSRLLWLRHLRAEQSSHVLRWRSGQLVSSGRGLAFWFLPWSASLAEVPIDDRELPFLVRVPSADFQEVSIQGQLQWRIGDPERVAQRVDFSLDLSTGRYREEPLESVAGMLGPLVRQLAEQSAAGLGLKQMLERGVEPVRASIEAGLRADVGLEEMGIEIVAVRVASLRAEAEVERALQMPTREQIQQAADEATFRRRALAVENERAIQENELQNKIELAVRSEQLVAQKGRNERMRVEEASEAKRIIAEAEAVRVRLAASAESDRIRAVEGAGVELERERMAVYRGLPAPVLLGLAARALAENLDHIEHLNVSPDLLGPVLTDLLRASTAKLGSG
ncbi:MAG TPA: band 7 protein [Deltaproteobacteria bacterium]|nr:band 7 protein [Deltaproteobacteria bacterium]